MPVNRYGEVRPIRRWGAGNEWRRLECRDVHLVSKRQRSTLWQKNDSANQKQN